VPDIKAFDCQSLFVSSTLRLNFADLGLFLYWLVEVPADEKELGPICLDVKDFPQALILIDESNIPEGLHLQVSPIAL